MTHRIFPENRPADKPQLIVGPRVQREIENRIRELKAHYKPSASDRKEIHKLEVFLHLLKTGCDRD